MPIKRVLIVDDSKSARLVLRKMLQGIELDVDMAASGEEALNYLNEQIPDAIFMDHAMPGMDGLQVVNKIRQNLNTEMIPIAMYTSKEENSYAEEVKNYGVVGILPKPATPDSLSQIIHKLNTAFEEVKTKLVERKNQKNSLLNLKPDPGASIEVIEDIAQTVAESVFEKSTETQLFPLLEKKLHQLKEDMFASIEPIAKEIVIQICEKRIREFSNKLDHQINAQLTSLKTNFDLQIKMNQEELKEIQKKIKPLLAQESKEFIQQIAEKATYNITNDICNTRIKEFYDKITHQLNTQISNLKDKLESFKQLSGETLEEDIQNKLKPILIHQATISSRMAAEQMASDISSKIIQDVTTSADSITKRMYILTGLAIFIGIIAASVVYYIK